MKQHITINDLNTLSEEGKKRLRAYWKPKEYDLYYSESYSGEPIVYEERIGLEYKGEQLPLLSIGQMIEFLIKDTIYVVYGPIELEENLADILWSAVKEVLEKNKEK